MGFVSGCSKQLSLTNLLPEETKIVQLPGLSPGGNVVEIHFVINFAILFFISLKGYMSLSS